MDGKGVAAISNSASRAKTIPFVAFMLSHGTCLPRLASRQVGLVKHRGDAETYLTVNADRYMLTPSVIIEAEYQGHDDQKDPIHQDQSGVAGSAAGSLSDLLWDLREPGILSGLREDG